MSAGARVIGVNIDLARLGPERAFADGIALPLRRLSEKPGFRPPVLLVDSLDEAFASSVAQRPCRASWPPSSGVRLILTTRDDPRVLAELGLEARSPPAGPCASTSSTDAPDRRSTMSPTTPPGGCGAGDPTTRSRSSPSRIGEEAAGNFLYAYYVVHGSSPRPRSPASTRRQPKRALPAGGLAGVYAVPRPRARRRPTSAGGTLVRPILAPLAGRPR